jgi:hypothetical protein
MATTVIGAKQRSVSHLAYLLVQLQCRLDAGNGSLLPLGRLLCLLRVPGLPVYLLLNLAHLSLCRKHLGAHLQQGMEKQDALGSGSLCKCRWGGGPCEAAKAAAVDTWCYPCSLCACSPSQSIPKAATAEC